MVTDLVIAARSAGVEREMEIEAAWYVLTILLRMGHPARMDEIVPKCRLFPASDEFLQFLCRMPNSPLFLSDGGFVTVSRVVEVAFREFVVGGASQFVPRVTVRFAGPKKAWDFGDVYFRCSSRKRKKMHQLPDPKRKAPLRHSNGGSAEDGPTSYLLPIENITQSPLTDKAHPAVPALMRRNNLSMDMIVTECSSGVVKEGMQWTPLLNCDVDLWHDSTRNCEKIDRIDVNYLEPSVSSKECDRVLDSEIKAYAPVSVAAVDDNFVAMTPCSMVQDEVNSRPSAVLRNHKEQKSEKVSNYGDIAEGLVVADSEDNRDQAQAEGAVGSSRDLLDIRMPPVVKLEAATTSLQCESSSSQKPEEIFLDRRLDTNPSVGLLNDAEIEDDKINKNKRAEALDSKQILKKLKRTQHNKLQKKGNRNGVSIVPKKQVESSKNFPNFESFVVEEEEGSGGYGTVYRARRKNDGKTFAVKFPHPRAHPYHIHNELKMLERFGGRCFIIKYEGFFKSGNSECFVLEHVEHDRPEVLKKEIEVSELQWYGYCMFRALASLHKQGIVHRDVKPGNFLFSRKHNKGYLIDFNLALDLNHKHQTSSKCYSNLRRSSDETAAHPCSNKTAGSSSKIKKSTAGGDARKKTPAAAAAAAYSGQVAEGSGVTSAREATSTRTPSVDRLREPIPCRGRKELISLVQEAMQSPAKSSMAVLPAQRKRIAAPLGKAERHLGFLTPMPLFSNGIPVVSALGNCSNDREKRRKTEGPCVGTKGFRAPEVLFKSIHQSCKVDVWSAGVTLLYLMIGRTPFAGDPEQNIKEIAKLRGSEDLWEVAKLHNRESSFPMELCEVEWMRKMKLGEWCERNTKRPEFLEIIPGEMWDLVERCLTVNPRLRISAEEALQHEFFAPCRDVLRKQRLFRQSSGHRSL